MQRSSLRHRLTAGIAILAVLLLFVAPMISKNLAEHHATMQRASALHAGMPMMHHHSDMSMTDHEMMGPGFACGYCDLLVHVPLVLWVFVPFIWWMCLLSRAPPPSAINPPQRRWMLRLPQPRAPPCFASHSLLTDSIA
ncbi:DUF2946 domain-containing protein [Pantoea sp. GD03673]|uniref:DUF2946 domain-containing protein n=1 Tax=Pantoea sp. GD03673 TaxID=2975364 RepID=UPI002446A46C|nr:DUF2946 domain-containing protein [Pantoea sp. GD03673]MDH2067042.1 DUF2946 domain-containing protein [Pantoea sp. GD03673]